MTKQWMNEYHTGEESVFQFLSEMTFLDINKIRKHYKEWCNADAYKTIDGKKKGFVSLLNNSIMEK